MPNPLVKVGPANTSNRDNAERPTPLTPQVESYAGQNFPWRGIETHGVEPTDKPVEPADWEDGRPVEYEEPKPPPDPVPVRIVSEGSRELRQFRTFGAYTGDNTSAPRALIGQDEERSRVTVKHSVESGVVYISHSPETCNIAEGWPLAEGETWSTEAHTPIFAWADSAVQLKVAVIVEYATKI